MYSAGAAEHSLVKGSKSSTELFESVNRELQVIAQDEIESNPKNINDILPEVMSNDAGKYLAVKCEPWRGIEGIQRDKETGAPYTAINFEKAFYSAVTWTELRGQQAPPVQEGDRWTKALSPAASKKIDNSARFLSKKRNGYKAMITLTFEPERRDMLRAWDEFNDKEYPGAYQCERGPVIPERKTIGKLCTAFLNNMQMSHKRGISWKEGKIEFENGNVLPYEAGHIRGKNAPFDFVWVIENPEKVRHTEYGPVKYSNPHVHILTNWTVKRKNFLGWAAYIEKRWGQGFAHIERLRKPASAGAYIIKAAQYMTKGVEKMQGIIRGNRYSISKNARAPRPGMIGTYAAKYIRDAIKYGYDLGRKAWPEGLYFHQHGFGANNRKVWRELWQAITKDGFKFENVTSLMRERIRMASNRFIDFKEYLTGHEIPEYLENMALLPFSESISLEDMAGYWGQE